MRGFVVRPTAEADSSSVARAVVGGDEIGAGVAFDLFVPDVNACPVSVELVSEDDVVLDGLLDKDTVSSIAVAGVEEGSAVDGVCI